MSSVITPNCNKCLSCIKVCPVECFHEDESMLLIDPDVCIDCGACQVECPQKAIFYAEDVPDKWKEYIKLNAEKSKTLPLVR